jgi:prevent-host-death family protein
VLLLFRPKHRALITAFTTSTIKSIINHAVELSGQDIGGIRRYSMSNVITANELKTKGVSALSEATDAGGEAIISVRGKNVFVVIPIEKYNYLRECELDAALRETQEDLKKGKFKTETVAKHMKRITRG